MCVFKLYLPSYKKNPGVTLPVWPAFFKFVCCASLPVVHVVCVACLFDCFSLYNTLLVSFLLFAYFLFVVCSMFVCSFFSCILVCGLLNLNVCFSLVLSCFSFHPHVVEILIQATAGIDEAGKQVCIVSVVTVILPFFQMAKSIWFPSWPM